MSNHDTYPGQLSPDSPQRVYEVRMWDPMLSETPLAKGQAVDAIGPLDDVGDQPPGSPQTYAVLKVPHDQMGQEYSYLSIGHYSEGYYIASAESDVPQLMLPRSEVRDQTETPVTFGTEIGTKIVVGRNGFLLLEPGRQPHKIPERFAAKVKESFGPQASREHFVVEIVRDGVRITDNSTNGTKVLHRNRN
jgi:hypothetical protein